MPNWFQFVPDVISAFLCGLYEIAHKIWIGMQSDPKDFQTLIGGGLALFGVLLTLLYNGKRLRKQLDHASQLDKQRHDREVEARRTSVRDALSAELAVISRFLQYEVEQARRAIDRERSNLAEARGAEAQALNDEASTLDAGRDVDGHLAPYRFSMPDRDLVYRSLIGQMPALNHEEVAKIIATYDAYRSFKSWVFENGDLVDGTDVLLIPFEEVETLIQKMQEANEQMNLIIAYLE